MKKLVSIITVTYNVADTIEKTIESVLNQTYNNIEYIIVDGMSTDGTWEKICKYCDRISVLIHEPDEGLYYAMNKGIQRATGDIIGIINGDDWFEADAVETAVSAMDDSTDATYGNIKLHYSDGSVGTSKGEQIEDIWFNMVPHPSIFVKREIYSKMGGFDTGYRIAADYEMILRFYSEGVRFKYLNHCFANFRKGGITTKKDLDTAREVVRISLKYLNKCDNKAKYLPLIEKRYLSSVFDHVCSSGVQEFRENIEEAFRGKQGRLCVFGAGYWGSYVVKKIIQTGLECACVIDNSIERQGCRIEGVEIKSSDCLTTGKWNVIIAIIKGHESVSEQLSKYNNPNMHVVWFPDINETFRGNMHMEQWLDQ